MIICGYKIKALSNLFTYEQMTRNSAKDLAVSDFLCTFAAKYKIYE